MKLKWLFALVMVLPLLRTQAQLLDSLELALTPEYTSLEEALTEPDKVIKLSLRKQKFKTFPQVIYKFTNLQYLDLSKNGLTELPDSLVLLKNLQYLIVSRNRLESLPNNIGKNHNLRYFNANQNEIGRIPYSFGELEHLEYLDLWSNNLDYYPETMGNLKNLKWMDLRNILIPQNHQDALQALLPNTKIYFSPPCSCSW